MPVVNLTDIQYAQLTEPKPLLEGLLLSPWIWLVIAVGIIGYVLLKYKGNTKGDPSTKPWWGREVRRDVFHKDYLKRMHMLGTKCNIKLEKGITKIGLIKGIEHDKVLFTRKEVDRKTRKVNVLPDFYYRVDRFKFRKYGLIAWIKSQFNFGWSYMSITPDSYTIRREDKFLSKKSQIVFNIDPTVHIINDSDVWTVSNHKDLNANEEFIIKAHAENLQGSELDFLRRLAVHSPTVASALEKLSHEARIKEEERRNKTSPYS